MIKKISTIQLWPLYVHMHAYAHPHVCTQTQRELELKRVSSDERMHTKLVCHETRDIDCVIQQGYTLQGNRLSLKK